MKKQNNRQRPNQKKARVKSTQRVTSTREHSEQTLAPRNASSLSLAGLAVVAAMGSAFR